MLNFSFLHLYRHIKVTCYAEIMYTIYNTYAWDIIALRLNVSPSSSTKFLGSARYSNISLVPYVISPTSYWSHVLLVPFGYLHLSIFIIKNFL